MATDKWGAYGQYGLCNQLSFGEPVSDPDDPYWPRRAFDRHDLRMENQINAQIESGHNALKAALLLNGGACLALLSFCAAVVTMARSNDDVRTFFDLASNSLQYFAVGALLAALAAGLGYLTNYCASSGLQNREYKFERPFIRETVLSQRWWKAFRCLVAMTITSTAGSYILFAIGLWQTRHWLV